MDKTGARCQIIAYACKREINSIVNYFKAITNSCAAIGFVLLPHQEVHAQSAVRRPIRSVVGSAAYVCPCPYDQFVRNDGRVWNCGGNSAWSRTGGREPTCYTSDYAAQMMSGGNITDWVDILTNCYSNPMVCRVQ